VSYTFSNEGAMFLHSVLLQKWQSASGMCEMLETAFSDTSIWGK